jgi:hypothetical protein
VTTDAVCLMALRVAAYSATSSRRACPACAASPCTVNDRWMLQARPGSKPTTTRTSPTPGLRSRSDPVPVWAELPQMHYPYNLLAFL